MNQLTHKEAERCARALGWTRDDGIQDDHWHTEAQWVVHDDEFDLHPYFWLGRLWAKLEEWCKPSKPFTRIMLSVNSDGIYMVTAENREHGLQEYLGGEQLYFSNPCLALCEAIEQLTKAVD